MVHTSCIHSAIQITHVGCSGGIILLGGDPAMEELLVRDIIKQLCLLRNYGKQGPQFMGNINIYIYIYINGTAMARHGLILGQHRATVSTVLLDMSP